jgi:hypothetical protein
VNVAHNSLMFRMLFPELSWMYFLLAFILVHHEVVLSLQLINDKWCDICLILY